MKRCGCFQHKAAFCTKDGQPLSYCVVFPKKSLTMDLLVLIETFPFHLLQGEVKANVHVKYTLITGIFIENGDLIANLLRRVFHSQIKIKCLMKM